MQWEWNPSLPAHAALAAARRVLPALALAAGILLIGTGCSQMSSDINDMGGGLFPPSPGEAARWAVDNTNAENQRRGIVLLGNSSFGGEQTYLDLYTFYIEENSDPLVKAASIDALARHGVPKSAALIARQLSSPSAPVRVAAARGLQRLHDPAVADAMWKKLVETDEDSDVRVELAIALGQYPRDDVFQALCTALDQRELAINLAAADSLRLLTAQDFGLDRRAWLSWYRSTTAPFRKEVPYYFPTYQRALGLGDYLMFWSIPTWEEPGIPAGLSLAGPTPTAEATPTTTAVPPPAHESPR